MHYFVSAMGTRYVEIPAHRLLGELRAAGDGVKAKGGGYSEGQSGREIVCDMTPPGSGLTVRVFTSLAAGEESARGCGEDALRIVVGAVVPEHGWRPAAKPRRVFRTAPKDPSEEVRVGAFIERMKGHLREAYRMALSFPRCPRCNRPMAVRESKKNGGTFFGCLAYPSCKGTRPRKGDS